MYFRPFIKGAPFKSIYNHHCWGPLCNRHINKSGQSFQKNPSSYFCEVHFCGIFPYLSPPCLSGWTGQAEQTGEWNWADYLVAEFHLLSENPMKSGSRKRVLIFPTSNLRNFFRSTHGEVSWSARMEFYVMQKNIIGILDQASAPSCHVKQMCKRESINGLING